jgi:ABC-type nitrate/sulfonate/bicarbonate transport system substrate-binding protein
MHDRLPRRAFLTLLGAAGVGVLSACGGATSAPASAAPSSAPASAKPAAPASAASAAASAKPATSASAKPAASTAASASPAASSPKPSIKAGWVSPSAAYSPLLIATDAGYFSNHGVNVEPVYIEGSSKLVAATIAGDVQVMLISGETAVDGNVNAGQDFAIIAATGDHSFQQVISGPKLNQPSDLKGKTVAVVTGGTVPLYQLTRALEIQGLSVKDSNVTYLGGYPAIISAIAAGQVDAGVMTTDFARLGVKQGLKVILDIEAMHILTPNTPVIAKRAYIKTHHDELLNFLRGYAEGIHRLKTDKAFAIQTMSKYFKIDDQPSLEGSYTDASKVLNDLLLPPAAVQAVLDEDGIKDRKPEEFMDMSIAQELHDDGFIDALWKS